MADPNHEKRMELTGHLQELRQRIIRSVWYLLIGAIVAYQFFQPLYDILYKPLQTEMVRLVNLRTQKEVEAQKQGNGLKVNGAFLLPAPLQPGETVTPEKFNELRNAVQWMHEHPISVPAMGAVFRNFHEMFMVRLTVSLIFGFILVIPLVIWELAMFVSPALTPQERRPLRMLIPLSIVLLLLGMAVAYKTMFFAMNWFLSYLDDFPSGATLMQDPHDYVVFFIKMMAAFGLAFQLPVVLMGGAWVGLVTSKGLKKHWRWGVVLAVLGGVFTPANDLPSMLMIAIPMMLLYFGSIFLVQIVENIKAKERQKPA